MCVCVIDQDASLSTNVQPTAVVATAEIKNEADIPAPAGSQVCNRNRSFQIVIVIYFTFNYALKCQCF